MPHARLDRDGDVAELVLASPPLNLFGPSLLDDLRSAVDELEAQPPRAMILRAEGDVFSAGADVAIFEHLDGERARSFISGLTGFAHRIEDLPFPTVALVGGMCLTAGFELALTCDLLWAAREAQFGLVEAVIGITPLMGGTERVADRAGSARARELVMTAGLYDAARLEAWGVVNRVMAADELLEKGRRFAARLAAGPTVAHTATKRIVHAYARHGLRSADDLLPDLAHGVFDTEDFRNGLRSFREQGPGHATFTGR